ncbi:ABC transporter substrate-binding protein [Marinobacterium sp. D7]|uniref:ABC transporter substrate-binding protein n=1 Tax=Marinobacterium ramblicola TaxID=2849041 RepID=UPI001C2D4D7C|nr:ABC transporter substrate-binding protein [Marinobacterium ramblicola]MBV1788244.1 ABC transporter substrate-binding protein [Marinobacterium ramblicola]
MCKLSVITGAVLGSALGGIAHAENSMTIVSWGGAYSEAQKRAFHDPWMEKTGDKILMEPKAGQGLASLRSQIEAGNVTWDLVDMLEGDAILACDEGIIEEIDYDAILAAAPDGTLPSKDFIEGSLSGCFIPQIVYATVLAYNDTAFAGAKPKTVADIFDLEGFPGKRALQKIPDGNMEWALVADGVSPKEVYDVLSTEEGVERAFKKLDTIKDQVVWWDAGAQPPQLLADKEVVIASGYNGRFFNAQVNEKQPFTIMWDAQMFELDGWVVPKGKLTDGIKAYLNFATDTQRLADESKFIAYGPARASSAPLVSTHADTGVDMKPHMPTNPANFFNPIKKDAIWWADHGDEMRERFNAWLAK